MVNNVSVDSCIKPKVFIRKKGSGIITYDPRELKSGNLFGDSSLKAYWRFGGNSNDSMDSHNGTNTNMNYSAGKFGQGAVFNSASPSYIIVPRHTDFEPSSFTISTWINTTQADIGIISSNYGGNYKGWYWRVDGSVIATFVGGGDINHNNPIRFGSVVVNNGGWHHVAFVYTGTQSAIFVDGVLDGSYITETYPIVYDGNTDINIGKASWYGGLRLTGSLDDLAFFNRVLTPAEIAYLALG